MAEQIEIITPRKIRARKIAAGVAAGKTYKEIAEEVLPNVKYPVQTVYNTLQANYTQAEIRANLEDDIALWTEETIAKKIAHLAEHAKNDGNKLKALELLAKWKAMLTEKREVNNKQSFETSKELKKVETEDLIQELETRLKLSAQGINTSENVAPVGNNSGKPNK